MKILLFIISLTALLNASSYDTALDLFEKKQYKESLEYLYKAQKEGDNNSLYSLGYMYYHGYGTKKDYKKALDWFLKAEKADSSKSYEYIGYMYGNGQGVSQSDEKAIYYYEQGVKNNNAGSMCDLSEYYIKGWGVQKNYFKALELVKKGHELGGSYCKKVWDKYNLASKKEKNQLNYNAEKKLCKQNFNMDPSLAIEHCEYAIQLQPSDNNSRFFLAISYFRLGQLEESLQEYNYLENQLLDNITMVGVYTQKGNVLMQQQKNDEALKYYNKALEKSDEKSLKILEATIYNGIGTVEMQNDNYDNALKYLNKALLLTNNKQLKMNIANNIGLVYLNQEKYKDSIDSLELALIISNEINDYIQKDLVMSNLAMAYLFDNQIKKAKQYSKDSIIGAEKTNNQSALFNSYLVYSSVMDELGNKKESDMYYDKASVIASQMGISFEDEETKTDLSPLNILKNMFKKSKK